jgi:putative ABC transport system permease protein
VAQVTLFSLVRKNIIGNFKNYLLYFISMILSVVIFYTFSSLQYSPEIQASIKSSAGVLSIFTQASVLLILFVSIFIWYSNSFFTRKRKGEIGLYSLLGVRKRTIGRMLFYENMIMGAIATAIGILLGTLLSKLFTMIFLRLLESSVHVAFIIPWKAVVTTFIVFTVITLLTSAQAYRLIYRFKLIELFVADKEGDSLPRTSVLSAIASIVILAFAYWLTFQPITTNAEFGINFSLIAAGLASGTYLLFRFVVLFLLKLFKHNRSFYYNGLNLIGLSQLMYRMMGNVRLFTVIALLSAFTICSVSVGYSSYYNIGQMSNTAAPFSYYHLSQGEAFDKEAEQIIAADREHPLEAQLDMSVVETLADASALPFTPSSYAPEEVPVKLIAASMFNQAQAALNRNSRAELQEQEAAVVRPMYTELSASDVKGLGIGVKLPEGRVDLEITEVFEERISGWGFPDVMLVVSDAIFADAQAQIGTQLYKAYKVSGQRNTGDTTARLSSLEGMDKANLIAYYTEYQRRLEEGGMNIFVLGFLGLVFLAATGSMIYFKQLTEARADKQRYAILRKIGVSRKDIRTTVAKQTFFVFALPLIVGLLHSAVILRALDGINLINGNLTVPISISMIFYITVYLIYYGLCVQTYNQIVTRG